MNSRIKLVGLGLLTIAVGAMGGVAVTTPAHAHNPELPSIVVPQSKTIDVPEALENLVETRVSTPWGLSVDGFSMKVEVVTGEGVYFLFNPATGTRDGVFVVNGERFDEVDSFEEVMFAKPDHDVDVYFAARGQGPDGETLIASYRAPRTYKALNVEFVEMVRDDSDRHMPIFKVARRIKGLNLTYLLFNAEENELADDSEFLVNGEAVGNTVNDPNSVKFTMYEKSEDMLEVRFRNSNGNGNGKFLASVSLQEK